MKYKNKYMTARILFYIFLAVDVFCFGKLYSTMLQSGTFESDSEYSKVIKRWLLFLVLGIVVSLVMAILKLYYKSLNNSEDQAKMMAFEALANIKKDKNTTSQGVKLND